VGHKALDFVTQPVLEINNSLPGQFNLQSIRKLNIVGVVFTEDESRDIGRIDEGIPVRSEKQRSVKISLQHRKRCIHNIFVAPRIQKHQPVLDMETVDVPCIDNLIITIFFDNDSRGVVVSLLNSLLIRWDSASNSNFAIQATDSKTGLASPVLHVG